MQQKNPRKMAEYTATSDLFIFYFLVSRHNYPITTANLHVVALGLVYLPTEQQLCNRSHSYRYVQKHCVTC